MAKAVALVALAALGASGCGGTLEDDYRRGRIKPSESPGPPEAPASDDGGSAAPGALSGTTSPGSIGCVGQTAPGVRV